VWIPLTFSGKIPELRLSSHRDGDDGHGVDRKEKVVGMSGDIEATAVVMSPLAK